MGITYVDDNAPDQPSSPETKGSSNITYVDEQTSNDSKPTIASEALKVAGQGAVGLSGGTLDTGNKPMSEVLAGMVGTNVLKGSEIITQKQVGGLINKFINICHFFTF
jgi:hypothetical protein